MFHIFIFNLNKVFNRSSSGSINSKMNTIIQIKRQKRSSQDILKRQKVHFCQIRMSDKGQIAHCDINSLIFI